MTRYNVRVKRLSGTLPQFDVTASSLVDAIERAREIVGWYDGDPDFTGEITDGIDVWDMTSGKLL